ncbi:TonB-dependent receptor [Stenotrophomonas koreensis]|uniref:TonB-dependent receptor n=1 Tax=Stenotrophomonas koreensis TaxID=266128 RepID=UPI001364DE53|nr:TonB-dependent receptor [Stenotrophomonas koreensis]
MKTSVSPPLARLRPRLLPTALALALAPVATAALANDTAPATDAHQLDAITVTGSQLQARAEIDARRESAGIVDSLSADDIGALPDLTIAESLRRIAGVTTVYNDDIGQFASIRAAHPDYVPVTLNGLSIATTGDHGEGTRKINLQVIPSGAVQQLQAFKSLSPEHDAGALAGLINIVPSSAFDAGQSIFTATVGSSYSTYMDVPDDNSAGRDSKHSPYGRSAQLSWAPTFANDTIGLMVTGMYQQRPRTQSNNVVTNRLYYNDQGAAVAPTSPDWNGVAAPDSFGAHSYTNMFTKHGGTVRLDWRPNERLQASLFGFAYYSDEQETRNTNRVFNLDQHQDLTASSGSARIRGVDSQWRYNDFNRDQMGLQGNLDWAIDDDNRLRVDAGRSRAWYQSTRPFVTFVYNPNTRLDYDMSGKLASFDPANASALLDGANFSNRNTYRDVREAHSYVSHLRADFGHNADADDRGLGFTAGLEVRQMDMQRDIDATYYRQRQATLEGISFIPDFAIPGYSQPALWLDADQFWNNVVPTLAVDPALSRYNSLVNDYQYDERTVAGYINGLYSTDTLRLSAGLRLDRTQFDARMARALGGQILEGQAKASDSASEWLPYLNASWSISPRWKLKASASQTLGRPNPESIATVENVDELELTINRGNPQIQPRRSTNLDLGAEFYFSDGLGMLTATVFNKQIDDDILSVSQQETIDGQVWTVTSPINGERTRYTGLELGVVNSSFAALHPALAPLGASFNLMLVEGKSSYLYQGQKLALDQLQYQSKVAGNASLFWALPRGSEIRLSANHQGKYLEEFAVEPWKNIWIKPFTTYDLTAKWMINPAWQVRLEGRNLFGAQRGRLTGPNGDLFRADLEVGRTWMANISYRY